MCVFVYVCIRFMYIFHYILILLTYHFVLAYYIVYACVRVCICMCEFDTFICVCMNRLSSYNAFYLAHRTYISRSATNTYTHKHHTFGTWVCVLFIYEHTLKEHMCTFTKWTSSVYVLACAWIRFVSFYICISDCLCIFCHCDFNTIVYLQMELANQFIISMRNDSRNEKHIENYCRL